MDFCNILSVLVGVNMPVEKRKLGVQTEVAGVRLWALDWLAISCN